MTIWQNISVYIGKLKKQFKNTDQFSNNDINLFCFWEKLFILTNISMNEKSLTKHYCLHPPPSQKKKIYINLNMEDITGLDHNHAKKNL